MQWIIGLYVEIAAFLFYSFIILANKSLRIKIVGAEYYYSLKEERKKIVFIFWHQSSFIPIFHYRGRKACILTMKSVPGRVLARTAQWLGYQVVQLEDENDHLGFRQMIEKVRQGADCNLAVDGPLGPIFQMKPGAAYLAKKLGNTILPIAVYSPKRMPLSWRWDKYFIPFPFSRAILLLGEPIDSAGLGIEELRKKCEEALLCLNEAAKRLI